MKVGEASGAVTPDIPGPLPVVSRPEIEVPALSCDCHFHTFGPSDVYPYAEGRSYTPPDAPLEAYDTMAATLGLTRGVIVQPSVYGDDNTAMMSVLARSPARLRGIAVVRPEISDAQLADLDRNGVRGLRFNALFNRGTGLDAAMNLASRIAPFGWHAQFLIDVDAVPDLLPQLAEFPVPVVLDHMGHPSGRGLDEPSDAFLDLLSCEHVWVKLSAPYRFSREAAPYADVVPLARTIVDRAPDRVVWGSDWPHPAFDQGAMPDDGHLLDRLADWCPDPVLRNRILVDNPARLYGF